MRIPNWLLKTKDIENWSCKYFYNDTISNKLGAKLLSFDECKKEVMMDGIRNIEEYRKKRKSNWPRNPDITYKNKGWKNYFDFFGKNERNFLSFKDCKAEVQKNKITSISQYQKNRKPNWPSNPNVYYKKYWKGYDNFFGKKKNQYLSYEECRKAVRKLRVYSMNSYREKRKHNWPKDPISVYASEWKSCYIFFGKKKKKFDSFDNLKKEVQKYKFKSQKEYLENRKYNWPANIEQSYPKQFKGWCDFLGKNKIIIRNFLSFEECRKEVRKYKFKNKLEYRKNRKSNWPAAADVFYQNQWTNWNDFLGNEKFFLSFRELQNQVRLKNIKNQAEYRTKYKKFEGWPSLPEQKYKKEWKNWNCFLGK